MKTAKKEEDYVHIIHSKYLYIIDMLGVVIIYLENILKFCKIEIVYMNSFRALKDL